MEDNQKFINFLETTAKKCIRFDEFRYKRFQRNVSASTGSRSSMLDKKSVRDRYIKSPQSFHGSTPPLSSIDPDHFFTQLSKDLKPENTSQTINKVKYQHASYDKENVLVTIKKIETELDVKRLETESLKSQNCRLKTALEKQTERRKKAEDNLKQVNTQNRQLQKKITLLEKALGRLNKQKEALDKHLTLLQKVKFNEDIRMIHSMRQLSLLEEIKKYKEHIKKGRSARQEELQKQNGQLRAEKFELSNESASLKLNNNIILYKLSKLQEQTREVLEFQKEYRKLKDKYLQILEKYKKVHKELIGVKRRNSTENEDASDILTISSLESERQQLQ